MTQITGASGINPALTIAKLLQKTSGSEQFGYLRKEAFISSGRKTPQPPVRRGIIIYLPGKDSDGLQKRDWSVRPV